MDREFAWFGKGRNMQYTDKKKIYIIGHKNPDTDSICSAIAYADIKNRAEDEGRYVAKRAGQISEETQYVLDRFQMDPRAMSPMWEPG